MALVDHPDATPGPSPQTLLDAFYDALRQLDGERLARLVTAEFVLHWQGTTALPWAGEWRGIDGLMSFVDTLNKHVRILQVAPRHTLHGNDCSIVVLDGHWKLVRTGVEVRAVAANIFTFDGDRIATYTVLNHSGAFHLAYTHD